MDARRVPLVGTVSSSGFLGTTEELNVLLLGRNILRCDIHAGDAQNFWDTHVV